MDSCAGRRRSFDPSPAVVTDEADVLRALWFGDRMDKLKRTLQVQCGKYQLTEDRAPDDIKERTWRPTSRADWMPSMPFPWPPVAQPFSAMCGGSCGRFRQERPPRTGISRRCVGREGASRAVGAANGANPIAIVVPCHRVVGAKGTLTGYGGGLANKRWLLGPRGAPFSRARRFLALSILLPSHHCHRGAPLARRDQLVK